MNLLLSGVEVDGQMLDVRVRGDLVTEVGVELAIDDCEVVNGRGGALLPGLHDHHIHLLALAAARESVDCSDGLAPLASHSGAAWVRGVGLTTSVDRHAIDAVVSDRPVRVQHRSGALWMLNSLALEQVAAVLDDSDDVERDGAGSPTGRLWRYDARLRKALPSIEFDLEAMGLELASFGLTSVTDATPDLEPFPGIDQLPQRVTFLGRSKLLLSDHDLPSYDKICDAIAVRHAEGLSVAVHCVTRQSLLLALAAFDQAGRRPGDRIEHAAVVPPEVVNRLRGLRVVTQPGFLLARGDAYLRDLDANDLSCLYPYASLLAGGVEVVASSDAPFGPLDPWSVMAAARDRRTSTGVVLGASERVPTRETLTGYLTDPSGERRKIAPWSVADLCLLSVDLRTALEDPRKEHVLGVWAGGRLIDWSPWRHSN